MKKKKTPGKKTPDKKKRPMNQEEEKLLADGLQKGLGKKILVHKD